LKGRKHITVGKRRLPETKNKRVSCVNNYITAQTVERVYPKEQTSTHMGKSTKEWGKRVGKNLIHRKWEAIKVYPSKEKIQG